jgi:hypothetical protein
MVVWIVVVSAFLVAGMAAGNTKCEMVNAHLSNYLEYDTVEACGVPDVICGEGDLVGTINGRQLNVFPMSGIEALLDDVIIWRGNTTLESKHGMIFTVMMGHAYLPTYDWGVGTNQETHIVTGGTGRYENANGYLLVNYEWFPPDPVVGELSGQICLSDE